MPSGLPRRHAAGAPSARGLLFTLLGEFVLPGGGTAWTSAVIAALARLGVAEKATRQALMRTAADGWLRAEKDGRRIKDGEVVPACAQACPAKAISFGDLRDADAEVSKWKAQPRNYGLLAELGVRPRTTYLARIENPSPELEGHD